MSQEKIEKIQHFFKFETASNAAFVRLIMRPVRESMYINSLINIKFH